MARFDLSMGRHVVLALALIGCREATEVVVDVSTDVPCGDLHGVTVSVGVLGPDLETRAPASTSARCNAGHVGQLVVVPRADRDAEIAIRVTAGFTRPVAECATSPGPGCIVSRRALRYIPHRTLNVRVFLARSCSGIPCGASETCVDGRCRPAIVDPASCASSQGCGDPPGDATVEDGEADVADASDGSDAAPESSDAANCSSDGDCTTSEVCALHPIDGSTGPATCRAKCVRASDCPPGSVCALRYHVGKDKTVLACDAAIGAGAPGASALSLADCQSATWLPLRKLCSAPCTAMTDCADPMPLCVSAADSLPGTPDIAYAKCLPGPRCDDKTLDCPAGSSCILTDVEGHGVCRPDSSGAPIGMGCASDTDCATGKCVVVDKTCSAFCTKDAQCGAGSCILLAKAASAFVKGACERKCSVQSDCPAGLGCLLTFHATLPMHSPTCGYTGGKLAFGDAAADGVLCISGLTLSGKCSQLCLSSSDCSAPLPSCMDFTIPKPGGGTETFKGCT